MQNLIDATPKAAILDVPPLLPEHEARPEVFSWTFSPAVRRAFRTKRRVPTREWAEKHREITSGSRQGRWKNENAPYCVGVFDAWDQSFVRSLYLCWAPQLGKTEIELTCLASAIDQDPGPAMIVMDVEPNRDYLSKSLLRPMLEKSEQLAQYLSADSDRTTTAQIDLQHMPIYCAYATSVSALAGKAVRYMLWDEIDKHPATPSKREADSISLGRKRQRTYLHTKKEIFSSSPSVESGPIWKGLNKNCQVVFHFWARCPECGAHQIMKFSDRPLEKADKGYLQWPEGADPASIEADGLAWYECERCGGKWDDYKRDIAVRRGEWRTVDGVELAACLDATKPRSVGFHLSALCSQFVPLGEIAAAFLAAKAEEKTGKREKLKDFQNGYMAEPWTDDRTERSEDRVLRLRDVGRPRMVVPAEALGLTCAIDTQKDYWLYEVRAWGPLYESWQIREGRVEDEKGLAEVLFGTKYCDDKGRECSINAIGADVQGNRTHEMYDLCRRLRIIPIMGESAAKMKAPWAVTNIQYYPGTTRPIPGGLKVWRVNVKYYKDWLARKLEIEPTDPGAWHLHSEATLDYARQMCAEYVDDKGTWVCPKNKPNHYWDIGYYSLFLAELAGIANWKEPKRAKSKVDQARQVVSGTVDPRTARPLPGWRGGR